MAYSLTFPAGRTLPTALVLVEFNEASNGSDNVGLEKEEMVRSHKRGTASREGPRDDPHRFVHDDKSCRAKARLCLYQAVKIHRHRLTHGLGDEGSGRASRDHSKQVIPAPSHTPWVEGRERQQGPGQWLICPRLQQKAAKSSRLLLQRQGS